MGGARSSADDDTSPGSEQVVSPAPRKGPPGHVSAFLFADIRDYTGFTDRRGADAAADLVAAFLAIAGEVAATYEGRLRGSWGDEVLLEFDSPRDAVRAAAELQRRCIEAATTDAGPPLLVGVGLDIGEAAGGSGGGLNVAARLCAKAAPGQVLATDRLAHTAGVVDGHSYIDHGRLKLKGVAAPTRVVVVRPGSVDRERERQFRAVVNQVRARRKQHRMRPLVAALTAAAVVAGLAAWGVGRLVRDEPVVVPPGGLAVVDAGSGRLVDAVPVGGAPAGVAAASGTVWVARTGDGTLARIDTRERQVVPTESVGRAAIAVVATGKDLWTVNGTDGKVHRINTTVNREVNQVQVGNQPVALAAGAGAVWVTNKVDGTLMRIDSRSGKVTHTAQVGRGPDGVVVSGDTVWVANGRDGTVSPVDARSMQVGSPVPVGAGPRGIAAVGDGVWVANSLELTVSHIDSRHRRAVATVKVGDSPTAVAAAGGSVWVSVSGAGTLVRIDPEQDRVIDTIPLGASARGVAAVDGQLWVATQPFARKAHFGGTLTVAEEWTYWDPASGGVWIPYDGLVALHKTNGSDGYDLVPDLAESVPLPTDGGRSYTFTVRTGIRYSDGQLLRPDDFRRGLARMFVAAPGEIPSQLYEGVVGGLNCAQHPDSCDLSAGITSDAHTVTFHLTAPDPDFLHKIANHFAAPAPPGSPAGLTSSSQPLPGTGPYAITEVMPGTSMLLTRNRYYRPWSVAAQPPGYPDRIRIVVGTGDKAVQSLLDGTIDAVNLSADVSDTLLRDVRVSRPDLVHETPFAFTWYLQLNTHEPPFDNVLARRALAYAVDRREFKEAYRTGGEPACQLLPPGWPGFEYRCVYTTNPDSSGEWHGPDLVKARQLVAQSGTKGASVDIWWVEDQSDEGRYLAGLLRQLGYNPRLHLVSLDDYFGGVNDPGTHKNVTANGWGAPDNVAAGHFFLPLLSCDADARQYCNPAVDRLATSALAAQDQDPGLADRLWRQVYATLDAEAAAIPLIHTRQSWIVSERVSNYQSSETLGPLFDQMWVR